MTLHLIKLSVGSESIESLAEWQAGRLEREGRLYHATRMVPRRRAELLDGGSIFWVIKGWIQARQELADIEEDVDSEGRGFCRLMLEQGLVPVMPAPHRPFQGWRYLDPAKAPKDRPRYSEAEESLPLELYEELRDLGLL